MTLREIDDWLNSGSDLTQRYTRSGGCLALPLGEIAHLMIIEPIGQPAFDCPLPLGLRRITRA